MKSVIKYFLYIFITGFTFTATAQNQQSTGKVPMTTEKPAINYGITNDAPTLDGTAYGHAGTSGNFVSMPIPAGDPFTIIAPMIAPGFFSSATFGPDGTLYFIDNVTRELYIVDKSNGSLTFVGSTVLGGLNGITYDWTNNVFWVCSETHLYTIEVATGNLHYIGPFGLGGSEIMIDVAVDCDGNMYGYELLTDALYSIDPATGAATLIGVLGFDANFGQGMSYDYSTGILYLSAFNHGTFTGQLRTVDVATGMTILVFDWGFEQIAPFAIDNGCGPPCPVGDPSNPNPADGAIDVDIFLQEITWDNPPEATECELFFGPVGSVYSVYSGPVISSFDLFGLDDGTTYIWFVKEFDGNCWITGPVWIFTTEIYLGLPFFEDFDGSWGGTWTITNNGGVCDWVIGPNMRPYFPPGTSGDLLFADSDLCGSGTTMNTTVTMDQGISTVGYTNVILEFAHDFYYLGTAGEQGTVEYSIDGGTTWTVIETFASDLSEVWVSGVIFGLGGQPDVRFRFVYVAPDWDWWWAIDNFFVFGTMGYPPPNAPSDLVAIANAPGQVLLNWQDNSDDENGFEIERKLGDSLSANNYQPIGIVGENITTYIDTTVLDTTLYTYKILAFNGFGFSYSNQAEVLTLIPVELTSFEGNEMDGNVQLKWSTATETNNYGFNVERKNPPLSTGQAGLNPLQGGDFEKIGFVQGHGTTTEHQSYIFMDESVLSGTYQYRLKQVDYDGSYEYSNIIEVEVGIPTEFSLEQNYPNPFNPTTIIRYSIPTVETGHAPSVQLIVYDVLGNEVATLVNEEKKAGIYEVEFSATGITSGIYFYRLTAGDPSTSSGQGFTATKKMLMIK